MKTQLKQTYKGIPVVNGSAHNGAMLLAFQLRSNYFKFWEDLDKLAPMIFSLTAFMHFIGINVEDSWRMIFASFMLVLAWVLIDTVGDKHKNINKPVEELDKKDTKHVRSLAFGKDMFKHSRTFLIAYCLMIVDFLVLYYMSADWLYEATLRMLIAFGWL